MMKVHSNSICILKKDGESPSDRRPARCRWGWAGGVWAERNRSCSPSCAWLCQCCAHKEQHRVVVFTNTVGTQRPLPKTTHIHTRTHMHACTHTDLVAKAVRRFVNAVHTKNRGFIFSLTQSEPRTHSPQQPPPPPPHTHTLQTNTPVHTHTHCKQTHLHTHTHKCTHMHTNTHVCTKTETYPEKIQLYQESISTETERFHKNKNPSHTTKGVCSLTGCPFTRRSAACNNTLPKTNLFKKSGHLTLPFVCLPTVKETHTPV